MAADLSIRREFDNAAGYIITRLGYRALFLLGAALPGLSALVFWILFRGRQGHV